MKILVTGGTGFVGSQLVEQLDDCVITTRNAERATKTFGDQIGAAIQWDYKKANLEIPESFQFEGVVNLMGESISEGRWTPEKKKRILQSRVLGTEQLVELILRMANKPKVVVSASAVGLYGDRGDECLDENAAAGSGFLAEVCEAWESATRPLQESGIRVVLLRLGIVLGKDGGALAKILPIFRLGIGGRLGNGLHYVPWIHIDDLVTMIIWAIQNDDVSGPVNGTAPNPVRNIEMTRAVAKALRRPAVLPVPRFALRLALGEFADSLLASQRVLPEAALRNGFLFKYPNIQAAIKSCVPQ